MATNESRTNLTIPPLVSADTWGRWRPELEVWTENDEINDTSRSVHICFRLTSMLDIPYGVWLKVYGPGNDQIAWHFIGYFTPGEYDMFNWNGLDDDYNAVSSGTYRIEGIASYTSYLYERQWGRTGWAEGEFRNPLDIVVGPDGYIYVSDSDNNRVQVFDKSGVYQRKIDATTLGGDHWLPHPVGIALDNDSNLYVASSYVNQIAKISPEGELLRTYGASGLLPGSILRADSVAVDSQGILWVTDSAKSAIHKILPAYTTGVQYGDSDSLLIPRGITVKSDQIFVASQGKNWIAVYTSSIGWSGAPSVRWAGTIGRGNLNRPMDVASGADFRFYVCDLGDYVTVFAHNGLLLTAFGGNGSGPGKFNDPNGIAVDEDGNVYVADTLNNRIQKFSSERHTVNNSTTVRVSTGFLPAALPVRMPFSLDLKPGSSVPDWIFLSAEYAPATPTPAPEATGTTEPADYSAFLDANGTPSIDPSFDIGVLPEDLPGVETPSTEGRDAYLAMMESALGNASAMAGESTPTPVPAAVSVLPAGPAMAWALVPLSLIAIAVVMALRGRRNA